MAGVSRRRRPLDTFQPHSCAQAESLAEYGGVRGGQAGRALSISWSASRKWRARRDKKDGSSMTGNRIAIIVALIVVVLVAAAAFLYFWQIPAPQQQVERTLPDDRFPH